MSPHESPESFEPDNEKLQSLAEYFRAQGVEVTFEKATGARPALTDSTKMIMRGEVDFTAQVISGVKDFPIFLEIDGGITINSKFIDELHQDQSFRSFEFKGPITIYGVKESERKNVIEKLYSANGVSIVASPKEITFA